MRVEVWLALGCNKLKATEIYRYAMQYRAFYSDHPSSKGQPDPDYARLVLVGYDTKDEALAFACNLLGSSGEALTTVVWKIEGPNGFVLERRAIEWEYARRTKP